MIVRRATAEDDAGIVDLMEHTPMPGAIRLAFGCRPSFFRALQVEGNDPVVCIAERERRIVAVGASTSREVFLNGERTVVNYLGSLRVAPEARGSRAMAGGYAQLARELSSRKAALTLTSILSDNRRAEEILTSGRAGLPQYSPFCQCTTYLLAPTNSREGAKDIRVEPGSDGGEIAAFLSEQGQHRNLFPVCDPDDFQTRDGGRFPGLSARDVLVVRDGLNIAGMLACWDVGSYRQALVTGYATWLHWARPAINAYCRIASRPALPRPGTSLPVMFGALCAVRDDDPHIFRALLENALGITRACGKSLFAITVAERDPLQNVIAAFSHRALRSQIYSVRFEGSSEPATPDERPFHFEAAML